MTDSKTLMSGSTSNPSEVLHRGLRVLSVPIRRVRGLTTTLAKLADFNYLFETVGLLTASSEDFDEYRGFSFQLEEMNARSHSFSLKCQYCDVDDMHPEISFGQTYRYAKI